MAEGLIQSPRPIFSRGKNDLLFDEQGNQIIDLFCGNGTVWLGHANPNINKKVTQQLDTIWITGGGQTNVHLEAISMIERFISPCHKVAALYSTGMEASEFAIRAARVVTGKPGIVGFDRSMHGKSLATAFLGWDNRDNVVLPQLHRLPFVPAAEESCILERLEDTLRRYPISAVFIEPLQGSGGGHAASSQFYREVSRLCRRYTSLLVFDEILTGFYRLGGPFYFSDLGICPDIVLVGKAMGNGFPVSGVLFSRDITLSNKMLPGSTYAGNPLASAAVVATLQELERSDPKTKVTHIDHLIRNAFSSLQGTGRTARGRGAMWIVELESEVEAKRVASTLYKRGVFVSSAGRILRLLPAITTLPSNLAIACSVIEEELKIVL